MPPVRRLTAILAADVAGYSRLMGMDEEGTHERLQAHLRSGSIPPLFCFEPFQPTGDPSGAEVAGMAIPEHSRIRISLQTAQT